MKISGQFEVKMEPLKSSFKGLGGVQVARLALDKKFAGELQARSVGEMLSAVTATQGSAGYVAIEQVTGTLVGLKGSFVLQHLGTMDQGKPALTLLVVPDSGSGELTGLSGTMDIRTVDGQHYYDFEFELD